MCVPLQFALDGTILSANDRFLGLMGYSLEEIVGKHHRMFVDAEYAASAGYAQFWAGLGRGEFQAGEFMRLGKGGGAVWTQATYNPVIGADGKIVKVFELAADITERKRIEALAKSQAAAINISQAVIKVGRRSFPLRRACKWQGLCFLGMSWVCLLCMRARFGFGLHVCLCSLTSMAQS